MDSRRVDNSTLELDTGGSEENSWRSRGSRDRNMGAYWERYGYVMFCIMCSNHFELQDIRFRGF